MADYNSYSNQELVALLKAKDQHAFTEIYNRFWKLIYAHVFKILKDDDDAKDVVQEVFGNLWIKADQIKHDANLAGMLYVAARNRVFNLIGKDKVKSDYLTEIASHVATFENHSLEAIDEKKIRLVLEREIQSLPPKMREIFELSRLEGLSHKEIGEKLGLSDQTVKKQVQNALKVIKPKLKGHGLGLAILFFLR